VCGAAVSRNTSNTGSVRTARSRTESSVRRVRWKDVPRVGGYAGSRRNVTSTARCDAARVATHGFAFCCRDGEGGRGELECEVERESGSGAEAEGEAGKGREL
jgi:hypothetical protein